MLALEPQDPDSMLDTYPYGCHFDSSKSHAFKLARIMPRRLKKLGICLSHVSGISMLSKRSPQLQPEGPGSGSVGVI